MKRLEVVYFVVLLIVAAVIASSLSGCVVARPYYHEYSGPVLLKNPGPALTPPRRHHSFGIRFRVAM